MKISTHFLLDKKDVTLLPITKKQNSSFNYVDFINKNIVSNDEVYISKQKSNSCVLDIIVNSPPPIGELKLTNQDILTWDDLWLDGETGNSIDPQIESINLQRNSLLYVNMNLKRHYLKRINLEGNTNLKSFVGANLPNLEYLDFTNCINLESVTIGASKNIKVLSLKNCRLTGDGLERVLGSFSPTKTASANIFPGTLPPFRKQYTTLLDLRGNDIPWGNNRIASKIRLLVTNNWLVLWDNAPPTSIIPIQMYAFFPNNIRDIQIDQYYIGPPIRRAPPPPEPLELAPTDEPEDQDPATTITQTTLSSSYAFSQPQSSPTSAPQPTPAPSPAPAPSPTPAPAPTPAPTPTPTPAPAPSPTPAPAPSPAPSPSPSPTPSPSPGGGYGGYY